MRNRGFSPPPSRDSPRFPASRRRGDFSVPSRRFAPTSVRARSAEHCSASSCAGFAEQCSALRGPCPLIQNAGACARLRVGRGEGECRDQRSALVHRSPSSVVCLARDRQTPPVRLAVPEKPFGLRCSSVFSTAAEIAPSLLLPPAARGRNPPAGGRTRARAADLRRRSSSAVLPRNGTGSP